MGKLSLATKLADELGSSVDEAMRFVDEVGAPAARNTVDELAGGASRTVENWWKPVAGTGAVVGGGALAWRQQDIMQAKAIASQQQDYSSAVESIMASDLSPEAKRELLQKLNQSSPASGTNPNNQGGNNGGDDGLLGGDTQTTLVLLIVVAFALKYTLGDDE